MSGDPESVFFEECLHVGRLFAELADESENRDVDLSRLEGDARTNMSKIVT